MSYSFGMYFKQLNDKSQIIDLMDEISKRSFKNGKDIIKNNIFYIPSERNENNKPADEYWLYNLFSIPCVYWEKYNIFALVGFQYDYLKDLFPICSYFQDSSDQNSEYENWGSEITLFNELKKEILLNNSKEIKEILETRWNNSYDDIYSISSIEDDLDYYQKYALYTKIYKTLELEDWLWDNKNDSFKRISVQVINSLEKFYEMKKLLMIVKKEFNE